MCEVGVGLVNHHRQHGAAQGLGADPPQGLLGHAGVVLQGHGVERLAAGQVAVVPGFQGVGPDHRLTTLGRGGSDTTAVALALSPLPAEAPAADR